MSSLACLFHLSCCQVMLRCIQNKAKVAMKAMNFATTSKSVAFVAGPQGQILGYTPSDRQQIRCWNIVSNCQCEANQEVYRDCGQQTTH